MRKPSRAAGRPSRAPSCRGSEGIEYPLADRLHRIERLRDIGEQDLRIVVGFVDRHPGEGLAVALGPLGQHGRLPVAGRRDHRGDRTAATPLEPLDQRRTTHRPGPKQGTVKLRRQKVERRSVCTIRRPSSLAQLAVAQCPMASPRIACRSRIGRTLNQVKSDKVNKGRVRPQTRRDGVELDGGREMPPRVRRSGNLGGLAGWRCWRSCILSVQGDAADPPLGGCWACAGRRTR